MPSKSFGPTTTTADTITKIGGADYTMPSGGTIRRIRIAGHNPVIDKAGSAKLSLLTDRGDQGPYEYAIQFGNGVAEAGMGNDIEIVSPAIALSQGAIVSWNVTSAEAIEDVIVSMEWA